MLRIKQLYYLMSNGNWKQAKALLTSILDIDPDNTVISLSLAEILLELEEFEEFNSIIDNVLEMADGDEKELIIFIKFGMLNSRGYGEEGLKALNKGMVYITDMAEYHRLRNFASKEKMSFFIQRI
jgi:tetratricopeptide (TPR) repeat protein